MLCPVLTGTDSLKYERYPGQGAYKLCFTSRDLDSVRKAQAILGDRFDFVVHPYGAGTNCFNGEIIPKGWTRAGVLSWSAAGSEPVLRLPLPSGTA